MKHGFIILINTKNGNPSSLKEEGKDDLPLDGKVMFSYFWDFASIIMTDYLENGYS